MTTDRTHPARPAAPTERSATPAEPRDGGAFAALLDAHSTPHRPAESRREDAPAPRDDVHERRGDDHGVRAGGTADDARGHRAAGGDEARRPAGDDPGHLGGDGHGPHDRGGEPGEQDTPERGDARVPGFCADDLPRAGTTAFAPAMGTPVTGVVPAVAPAVVGEPFAVPVATAVPRPAVAVPVSAAPAAALASASLAAVSASLAQPVVAAAPAAAAPVAGLPAAPVPGLPVVPAGVVAPVVAPLEGEAAQPGVPAPVAPAVETTADATAEPAPAAAAPRAEAPAATAARPAAAPAEPAAAPTTTATTSAAPAEPVAAGPLPGTAPLPGASAPYRAVPLHRAPAAVATLLHVAAERGISHAKMALRPVELGGIEIRLQSSPAGISAQVVADSPEAAKLLAQAGDDLRRALEARDVTLLSLEVSTSSEERRNGARGDWRDGHDAAASSTPEGAEREAEPTQTSPTVIELPGGLLVDVLA